MTGGAFGQFLNEKRAEISQLPNVKGKPATAVVKVASERFKALDDASRKQYEEKYEQAKQQYEKDMAAFLAAGGEKKAVKRKSSGDDAKVAKKQKKDPAAPKKPVGGAFGCFTNKNRAEFAKECEGKPVTAVTKLAAERWKELSDADKKAYEDEYAAKKAAYDEAMKSYIPPADELADEATETKEPTAKEAKAAAKKEAKVAKEPAKGAEAKAKAKAKSVRKPEQPAKPDLQPAVAAKAEKAGLTDKLLSLAARPEIVESGISQAKMLAALQESGGLIHPARRALLGA